MASPTAFVSAGPIGGAVAQPLDASLAGRRLGVIPSYVVEKETAKCCGCRHNTNGRTGPIVALAAIAAATLVVWLIARHVARRRQA